MDAFRRKERKGNLIIKTWERCKSICRRSRMVRSKSCPRVDSARLNEEEEKQRSRKRRVAPEGCFSVYVGPQKQRFVIKTEYANHPLFKLLLEEAELEYGFHSEGPLELPCKADVFYRVLLAMDHDEEDDNIHHGCAFAHSYGSYRLLSPSPMTAINEF